MQLPSAEVGTGYAEGIGNGYPSGAYWSIHTGRRDSDPVWLTGVVYNDANSNNRYDQGEGIAGVTITATGSSTKNTTTTTGGGWSIDVSAGGWTVTCSGGSFSGTASANVTVSTANIAIDFTSGDPNGEVNFRQPGRHPTRKWWWIREVEMTVEGADVPYRPLNPVCGHFCWPVSGCARSSVSISSGAAPTAKVRTFSGAATGGCMLRFLASLLVVISAGSLAAQRSFEDFTPDERDFALFEVQDETSESESTGSTFSQIEAASQWRSFSLEASVGLIGSKRTMWSGSIGAAIPLFSSVSLALRAEYNMELGASRSYRPQTRGFLFEPCVRFHLDFDDYVAFFSQHGLSASYRLDYFQLDDRVSDSDIGLVNSLGVGAVNTVGLEFGEKTWRGYVSTGLRTQFVIYQDADEDAKGYKDDIREGLPLPVACLPGRLPLLFLEYCVNATPAGFGVARACKTANILEETPSPLQAALPWGCEWSRYETYRISVCSRDRVCAFGLHILPG